MRNPQTTTLLPGEDFLARHVAEIIAPRSLHITGTIVATATISVGRAYGYECTVDDGTGRLDIVYLGRRAVAGLRTGVRIAVEGRAGLRGDRPVVWNPRYRLEPESGADSARPLAAKDRRPEHHEAREIVEAVGHFRIYLGAAAGVGKTCAMLQEGHRRAHRGRDVVIGFVESHGRPVTEAKTAGLEIIPRKTVEYRGATFEEMDLDAILARHPEIALVDELAHTNVPGSGRNDKRWQDIRELLAADIDVITTVNIQHLESIADTVERITGVAVRERVPDTVVRQAGQIELVDSSPEQLRRRMVHGNIYPTESVQHALSHFFRTDNLTALRELTLRFLADETDEELVEALQQTETQALWETAERILVGVTAAPGTDAVIRRACRMAARFKADLHLVHVVTGDARPSADDGIGSLKQLGHDVGAQWTQIRADDPAQALMEFARQRQITQIVLGPSQRSRWQELLSRGSRVKRISRLASAAGIDVHIIARSQPPLVPKEPPCYEAAGRRVDSDR